MAQQQDEATEFARRMALEQRQREKHKRRKEQEAREKFEAKLEVESLRRSQIQHEIAKKKQKQVEILQEKAERRKMEMEQRFQYVNRTYGPPQPLYEKIETEYNARKLMPELDRQKQTLNFKRDSLSPINNDALREHQRRHKNLHNEMQERREKAAKARLANEKLHVTIFNNKSKFTHDYQLRDQEAAENAERIAEKKHIMKAKAQNYGQLVREMYKPTVDNRKKVELETLRDRSNPKNRRQMQGLYRSLNDTPAGRSSSSKSKSGVSIPKRQWKPNNMIPERAPKRESKATDYLMAQRQKHYDVESRTLPIIGKGNRSNLDWSQDVRNKSIDHEEKAERLIQKARKIETVAKRQELMLSNLEGKDIDAETDVNDMLVESIKAKLALLDTMP